MRVLYTDLNRQRFYFSLYIDIVYCWGISQKFLPKGKAKIIYLFEGTKDEN